MLPLVVLDACVLFPMPLCDTLLRAAEAELYRPHFSQEILDEATRNLVKKEKMTTAKAARYQEHIKNAFPEAMVEVPDRLIELMTNHIKDRHVLAAAVKAKAEAIVTFNLKDFSIAALETFAIEAQHPDNFLLYLCENYTVEVLAQVVRQQAEDLKNPPNTVKDVLNRLSKQVPMFAEKLLCHEYGYRIAQIAEKILNQTKNLVDGALVLDGNNYYLWKKDGTLTITDKNGRGKILKLQRGRVEGKLSVDDINTFEKASQSFKDESQ